MGVQTYDQPFITGLTDSGVADGSGAWNTGVDIGAQVGDIPLGATGVLIKTVNNNASGRWAGIRINGEVDPEFLVDLAGKNSRTDFIPFSGSAAVDLYRESADVEFRVVWVLDSKWTFFPKTSRPAITSSGGSFASRTIAECPADAAVITTGFKWRPTGETTHISNNPSGQQIIKLDAAKSFLSAAQSSQAVIGYTSDAIWYPWLSTQLTYVADSTWNAAANVIEGAGLYLLADKTGTTLDADFRAKGSAYAPLVGNAYDESYYTDTNTDGEFDYLVETGFTAPIYLMARFPAASSEILISSIDQLITGKQSAATFSVDFSPSSFSVAGSDLTKLALATSTTSSSASFTPAQWQDGTTGIKIGAVSVDATDGESTTEAWTGVLSMEYHHPDTEVPFAAIELTTVDSGALVVDPPLQVGTQILYDESRFTVSAGGIVGSDYSGESALWYRNPDDKITRLVIITT